MIQFDEHIFQLGWFNHQLVTQGFNENRRIFVCFDCCSDGDFGRSLGLGGVFLRLRVLGNDRKNTKYQGRLGDPLQVGVTSSQPPRIQSFSGKMVCFF